MPTHTFLVAINLPDTADLTGISEQIDDDLSDGGLEIISVKPWSDHLSSALGNPNFPTTGNQFLG